MLKFLLAAAMLGSLGGAGGGTLAARLHHHAAGAKVSKVQIALAKPGTKNRLSVPGVALAAGDRLQRPFDLSNSGGGRLTALSLTTAASPSSTLDTDPVNGLQLQITRCKQAWNLPKHSTSYSCKTVVTTAVSPRPVIGSNVALANVSDLLAKKGTAHLLLTLTLPSSATNAQQGQSSSLTYTFTGTGAASHAATKR